MQRRDDKQCTKHVTGVYVAGEGGGDAGKLQQAEVHSLCPIVWACCKQVACCKMRVAALFAALHHITGHLRMHVRMREARGAGRMPMHAHACIEGLAGSMTQVDAQPCMH